MENKMLNEFDLETPCFVVDTEDFKNNILPKIYDFYMDHLEYKDNNFEYILLVDLVEDKLFIRSGRF